MKYVFDSTIIIHLCRINKVQILENLKGEKYITTSVFDEVVTQGKARGADTSAIELMIDRNVLSIKAPKNAECLKNLSVVPRIGAADIDVLCLSKEIDAFAVIDDIKARNVAYLQGIGYTGTAGILVKLVKTNMISKNDAKSMLDKLIANGWRCSTEFYSIVLDEISKA